MAHEGKCGIEIRLSWETISRLEERAIKLGITLEECLEYQLELETQIEVEALRFSGNSSLDVEGSIND